MRLGLEALIRHGAYERLRALRGSEPRATDYAELFDEGAHLIGFDGTMMDGKAAIADHREAIFAHHRTATYVSKLLGVDAIGSDVSVLRAVVGIRSHPSAA